MSINPNDLGCQTSAVGELGLIQSSIQIQATDKPFSTLDQFVSANYIPRSPIGFTNIIQTQASNTCGGSSYYIQMQTNAAAQTIEYTGTIDLSSINNGIDRPFLVIPVAFQSLVGGATIPALTLAQRTVRFALQSTDSTPKVYSDSTIAIGTLTPTITDPNMAVVIGDPSVATLDVTANNYSIKLDLTNVLIGANASTTKNFNKVVFGFSVPANVLVNFGKSNFYASAENYCPEGFTEVVITAPRAGSMTLEQVADPINDNPNKYIEGYVARANNMSFEVDTANNWALASRILGATRTLGGYDASPTVISTKIPATAPFVYNSVDIDALKDASEVKVSFDDGCVCNIYKEVVSNPMAGQYALMTSNSGLTKKLVFNSADTGKAIKIEIRKISLDNVSYDIPNISPVAYANLISVFGNATTLDAATVKTTVETKNFSFKVTSSINIGLAADAKTPTIKLKFDKVTSSQNINRKDLRITTAKC